MCGRCAAGERSLYVKLVSQSTTELLSTANQARAIVLVSWAHVLSVVDSSSCKHQVSVSSCRRLVSSFRVAVCSCRVRARSPSPSPQAIGDTSPLSIGAAILRALRRLVEGCCRRDRSSANDPIEYHVGYPDDPWEDYDLDGRFSRGVRRRL